MKITHGSLFTGIGGFDLAAEWAGFRNVFACEINKFCREIIKQNFNQKKIYEDIRKQDFKAYRGKIDIISGGFPCQDISVAGRMEGIEQYTRSGLFYELIRVIEEIQPRIAIFENVPQVRNYEDVPAYFKWTGYRLAMFDVQANWWGYPHRRKRTIGIAANAVRYGLQEFHYFVAMCEKIMQSQRCAIQANNPLLPLWTSEYDKFIQLDYGVSNKVASIQALGNAVIPIIPYTFFEILKETLLKK